MKLHNEKCGNASISKELNFSPLSGDLFERVSSILEQARSNVVRAVNSNIVLAYWFIGREIVQEIQKGAERAEYGKQVLEDLSRRLMSRYRKGFSVPNLQNFRKFYLSYPDRIAIQYPVGTESAETFPSSEIQYPEGRKLVATEGSVQAGNESPQGFSPHLSWSHYRALMRVGNDDARRFYESEAAACGWDKRTLERHIHSQFYERMLKSQDPHAMLEKARKADHPRDAAIETLKNPYVFEFLGLPEVSILHETQLEAAIITHLQTFLLELGKGFAFVARQKRLHFDDTDLYVDLVFYNCILKCYLLIDLETKYMLYLPTEEELARELAKERRLIEAALEEQKKIP